MNLGSSHEPMLVLRPGHIHQAISHTGTIAIVWPSPQPDRWQVSLLGYPPQATTSAMPGHHVEDLLDQWNFRPEHRWRSWIGPVHERSPNLRQLEPPKVPI